MMVKKKLSTRGYFRASYHLTYEVIIAQFMLFAFLHSSGNSATSPNILFILTDDQDVFMNGTGPMTKTRSLIGDMGITFTNMFVTTPLCCPSRSSILTGRYVHNHKAINNSIDGNCSSTAWQNGPERKTFATFLQQQGYETFFAGKYLNQYGNEHVGGLQHIPPGWKHWNALKGNSVYYNYSLSVDGTEEHHGNNYEKDYLTDVINRKATDFLVQHRVLRQNTPFMMMLSTPACHAPFTSAPQHNADFNNMTAPRTASFNKHGGDKHWLVRAAKTPMGNVSLKYVDDTFRKRWRTLLSVDDMVENMITLLTKHELINNTYIIFTSDNGFHLGQFSLPNDKRQMYDFDIRVPLMVRGPNITHKQISQQLVLNIDLAPTILDLAGVNPPPYMDGESIKTLLTSPMHADPIHGDFLVEHIGEFDYKQNGCPQLDGYPLNNCFPDCVCEDSMNNTYICVRRLDKSQNLMYCGFTDNEQFTEAYDLSKDPDQMTNVVKSMDPSTLESLTESLASLALCKGTQCHHIIPNI